LPLKKVKTKTYASLADVCGSGPDGMKKQGWMLNPKDCDNFDDCNGNMTCEFEYLCCAEELEIYGTLLLTKHKCLGDGIENSTSYELCNK
jgi:hypothetical protein